MLVKICAQSVNIQPNSFKDLNKNWGGDLSIFSWYTMTKKYFDDKVTSKIKVTLIIKKCKGVGKECVRELRKMGDKQEDC